MFSFFPLLVALKSEPFKELYAQRDIALDLVPSWAPLPSAEGGSHSIVTPRVDLDFTSKLVGIEGLSYPTVYSSSEFTLAISGRNPVEKISTPQVLGFHPTTRP